MSWLQGNGANEWILKISTKMYRKGKQSLLFMNRRKIQIFVAIACVCVCVCVVIIWYLIFLNELLVAVDCVAKLLPHG